MSEVRALYRPGREERPKSDTAPTDRAERQEIVEFLDVALMRPLWADVNRTSAIEQSLDCMTIPERVFIELEMRDRQKSFYTFDYDPLR